MRRLLLIALCVFPCLVFFSCNKPVKNIVRIGSTVYTQEQFLAFQAMKGMYPVQIDGAIFPGRRSPISEMVEIEVLYARTPGAIQKQVAKRDDWKWKKIYFPAQKYIETVWYKNKGISEKAIEAYYKSHRSEYKIKSVAQPQTPDSVGKKAKTKHGPTHRPLMEVRNQIITNLFIAENPPDSLFISRFATPSAGPVDSSATATAPTTIDTAMMHQQWINFTMNDFPMFFVKKAYQKIFNQPFPDSMNQWYGEGKYITPTDIAIVLNWLPVDRRSMFENDIGQVKLRTFLLQWKVASEAARQEGLLNTRDFSMLIDWAWKKEVVGEYLDSVLIPQIRTQYGVIDSALSRFSFWDEQKRVIDPATSPQAYAKTIERLADQQVAVALDSAIYRYRQQRKVVFFKPTWRDEMGEDPAKLIVRGDSLRDAGNTSEAEMTYQKVSTNFAFTLQGLKAASELAKIQTEKGLYTEAINNYRFCMMRDRTGDESCKTIFMIGFIYDEYLNNPQLAEVNYKWILKNTPDCELADDVEFMCLHLDEPMCSVEELQAQAKRQGRKMDDGAGATVDAE